MEVLEGLREARKLSKKRKFSQSWDLCINLKSLDLKKPENRIRFEFPLPHGTGRQAKVAVFSDSVTAEAEKVANLVIAKADIDKIAADKKKAKKIASEHDWFFAEASLMPLIGKTWGTILGPKGKVPRPFPPKVKIEPIIKSAANLTRVMIKEAPVIQLMVGNEKMADEDVARNIEALYNSVKDRLPKGSNNIRSLYIKLTMGRPVKVEVK